MPPTTFEAKAYDVSINFGCWLCVSIVGFTLGIHPYSTQLHLGAEEVTKNDKNICGQAESKRPYGELGDVSRQNCCCFVSLSSSFGEVSPGCGCDGELVDEIVKELNERQRGRGDTAQINRVEQALVELETVNAKLDGIMKHLGMDPSMIPSPVRMERD